MEAAESQEVEDFIRARISGPWKPVGDFFAYHFTALVNVPGILSHNTLYSRNEATRRQLIGQEVGERDILNQTDPEMLDQVRRVPIQRPVVAFLSLPTHPEGHRLSGGGGAVGRGRRVGRSRAGAGVYAQRRSVLP